MEDLLVLVDESGVAIGTAPRQACHGDPARLHAVAHVLVFTDDGKVVLQLRAAAKDVCPGLWDTSVGGHLAPAETPLAAARREAQEELGIDCAPEPLYTYIWRTDHESEFVHSHVVHHNGPFRRHPEEVEAIRLWSAADVEAQLGTGLLTPNFEHEWQRYREYLQAERND